MATTSAQRNWLLLLVPSRILNWSWFSLKFWEPATTGAVVWSERRQLFFRTSAQSFVVLPVVSVGGSSNEYYREICYRRRKPRKGRDFGQAAAEPSRPHLHSTTLHFYAHHLSFLDRVAQRNQSTFNLQAAEVEHAGQSGEETTQGSCAGAKA